MRYFVTILVFAGSFLATSQLHHKPAIISARHYAPPPDPNKEFGDNMLYFVRHHVKQLAENHIPLEYAARSLNAFQVTLDKARDASNKATDALNASDPFQDSLWSGVKDILRLDSLKSDTLSERRLAQLSYYSSQVNNFITELGNHFDLVNSARNTLNSLDTFLTFDEFREQQLHRVATAYVLSSISGGAPSLDKPFAIGVTFDDDGNATTEGNAPSIIDAIIGLWNSQKEEEEFKKQLKKYKQALEEVQSYVPAPSVAYEHYVKGFQAVKTVYAGEPVALKGHMDSIKAAIADRANSLNRMRIILDDGLLSDRVRAASRLVNLKYFDVEAQLLIKDKIQQVADAKANVLSLVVAVNNSQKKLATFHALQDIQYICRSVDSFIQQADTVLLFRPVIALLRPERSWFARWNTWATDNLASGKQPAKMKLSDKAPEKKSLSKKIVIKSKAYTSGSDHYLSMAINWPSNTSYGGGPTLYHQRFGSSGSPMWTRGPDGSFLNDSRVAGGIIIREVRENLELRTVENNKRYAEGSRQATMNAPSRMSEISRQASVISLSQHQTRTSNRDLPSRGNALPAGSFSSIEFPRIRNINFDGGTTGASFTTKADNEWRRQHELLSTYAPDDLNSPPMQAYQNLHRRYMDYASALWKGGYSGEGDAMFGAASGLRSELSGFSMGGELKLPTFNKPDIPYNPFTKDDHQLIEGRRTEYLMVNDNLRSKTRWYEAAALVTQWNSLGLAEGLRDMQIMLFNDVGDFLRTTNQSLYPINMANAIKIQSGTLNETFTTPSGEVVSFEGKSGKDLDYALVKYEQTKVEAFIRNYPSQNPHANMRAITLAINLFMNYYPAFPSEIRASVPDNFNFANYEDRVKLGQRIIDALYKKP